MESAKHRLSKLSNTVGKAPTSFRPGDLLMLWRQKNRPGKVSGGWVGPVRLLLQEGGTLWLATGATLIRARTTQVRKCTKHEDLASMMEGTAVLSTPTTVETLMRNFTGKHYVNVTGEVPSLRQRQDDVQGADVVLHPGRDLRPDSWKIEEVDNVRWLVRQHQLPRLTLFIPSRTQECPVDEEQLTGHRVTRLTPLLDGSRPMVIEDNYKTSDNPQRQLQERWCGETRFMMKPENKRPKTSDTRKKEAVASSSSPQSGFRPPPGLEQSAEGEQVLTAPDPESTGGDGAGGCVLPGGHDGPHEDGERKKFSWEPYAGKVYVEPSSPSSASSIDSSDSEELRPDEPVTKKLKTETPDDLLYMFEIPLDEKELNYLEEHPKKASIWLSKKLENKGKELRWSQMPLSQKMEFDEAQSKELSQVLVSKAVRSLTAQEEMTVDRSKVMAMRWVMNLKAENQAKARLVVLGYQQPNLTTVQASAPTMSRIARNLLLTLAANFSFTLMCGDVSSAFLQADQSLEEENLYVWAPAELAVLYGADPDFPMKILKICRAFYGLVHAPRKWFDHVVQTLHKQGWQQLLSDKCVHILIEDGKICGLCGLHVDDFIIAGDRRNHRFQEADRLLREAYRWGKWQEKSFTFAGCDIVQREDGSITINQETYVNKWLDECVIDPARAGNKNLPLTVEETSQLRGILGTLSWKASQTGPQYQADVSLLLSEIKHGTIDTLQRANKLVREVKRDARQSLKFPAWGLPLDQLAVITWCDASQHNRPDKSSTLGLLTAVAPRSLMDGEERDLSIVTWRSAKTPRQCLGSNGAEVQAITEGEDVTFRVRSMLAEMFGYTFENKEDLYAKVKALTHGAIVMDSRGVFDAMTRNISSLHGLRSTRAGYELALAVCQANAIGTAMRWVNGLAQLGDSLTKRNDRRVILQLLSDGQRWRLIHDERFTSGRKMKKQEMLKLIREQQQMFVASVAQMAQQCRWPWTDHEEPRSMGDERIQLPLVS
eukprot:Skav206312  [mRNA]  locus=scaffold3460:26186:29314:+ [translate_table: standard]